MTNKSMGGTELQLKLLEDLPKELVDKFEFVTFGGVARNPNKKAILYCHETVQEGRFQFLSNPASWDEFASMVFVSNFQLHDYNQMLGVPYQKTIVMENAIIPFRQDVIETKEKDKIKLIYTPMINRGLEILVPVFIELAKIFPQLELDVFSSFKLYGWEQRDKPYEKLIQTCKDHPQINYHGSVSNEVVREYLEQAHIFAYPSIYTETSCRTLMEAMSAGLICVHPNLGALPETSGGNTMQYGYTEDPQQHANVFGSVLKTAIENLDNNMLIRQANIGKIVADNRFNWNIRKIQWISLLETLK